MQGLKVSFIIAASLRLGATVQAANIVDFTHQDGTHDIRIADVDSTSGDAWNFSDSTLLFDGPETANDSNTQIYGGLKATWNSADFSPNLQLRDSDDRLQLQVNAETSAQGLEGMLVWNKADFLNLSGETVVFDSASSMSLTRANGSGTTTLRFVVNNGGIYYVSKTSGAGSMTLNNPVSDTWAPIYTNDYSIGMYAVRTFSDIREVGIYIKQEAVGQTLFQLSDFLVSASTPKIYRVDGSAYGATPDDDSDDDGGAIQDCIDDAATYAKNNGPAMVRFSPGTYHIHDQQRFFKVSRKTGADCLIIDGDGCTLMNTHESPMGLNFAVSQSENVTIRNMTIRSKNCMWVEGEIVEVNNDGTYDVQLRSDSPPFDAWGTIDQGRETNSFGFAWPCAKGLYSAPPIGGKSHVFVTQADPVPGQDGRWTVTGFDDGVTGVGDTYAMWNDWTHWVDDEALGNPTDYQSFLLDSSSNVELNNITLMAGSKMAVRVQYSSNVVLYRFKTLPDADRAVAMARDGVNINDCSNILMRSCVIGFNGDDAINSSGGSLSGSNMIFEDNLLCYSRRYAMLNLSDNSIFRNNVSYYNGGSTIVGESVRAANNLLIANNVSYSSKRNDDFAAEIRIENHSDVTITNNQFFECEYPLLLDKDNVNLVFENNHLDRGDRSTASYIVTLSNSENATLKGNTTATVNDDIEVKGTTSLTAGSQTAFGHDTTPEFDHARVLEMLGWATNAPPVPSTTVVLDLERLAQLDVAPYFTGGLNAAVWLTNDASPTVTLIYDISGAGLGGVVDSLEVRITSLNGENLTTGGGNGISVLGGANNLWWDVGEDLTVNIALKQGGMDVTYAYDIGLTGVGLRKNSGEAAVIASQPIAAGEESGAVLFSAAVDLGERSNQFSAKRTATAGSYMQFGQIQLAVEAIPVDPVEVVANMGVNASGFAGGIEAASYPNASSSSFNLVYDISGLDLGVDTLELLVTSSGVGGNIKSAGGFGLTTDGVALSSDNWWDVGEDLDFSVSIKKGGVDVTSAFSVDLTGFAMRWRDSDVDADSGTAVTASVAGESQTPSSSGDVAVEAYSLASGETNEISFAAARSQANDIAQLGQLRFELLKTRTLPTLTLPAEWLDAYGLSGSDADFDADLENGGLGDGLNNLMEYALGGNPAEDDAEAVLPLFFAQENHFDYVHTERDDDSSLSYAVEVCTNLASNDWSTAGVEFVGSAPAIQSNYITVTNRIPVVEDQCFIRLRIDR